MIFQGVLFYIKDEGTLVKKIIVTAASLAVFLVGCLSGFSLITKDSASVNGDGATFDLVSNGV